MPSENMGGMAGDRGVNYSCVGRIAAFGGASFELIACLGLGFLEVDVKSVHGRSEQFRMSSLQGKEQGEECEAAGDRSVANIRLKRLGFVMKGRLQILYVT